jgi:hypothetical protein
MDVDNSLLIFLGQDIFKDTGGMFDWSYFDNSKVKMFDGRNVSYLKKNIFIVELSNKTK